MNKFRFNHGLIGVMGIVVLLALTGCPADPGKSAVIDENAPLEFSWYVAYDWFSPPNEWGKDPVSAWMIENKKVNITWMNPAGASGDKLNLMIATGELPDVMCMERGPRVGKMVDSGLLLALDPYLDELPNLKKWAGINLDLLRYTDGKLYQWPNWYLSPLATSGNGNNGWGINTKVYKALGSPKLTTFDDMEAYLIKVKATYPDMIPLEAGDGFQAGQLVYRGMDVNLYNSMDQRLGTPKDGKFTKIFDDPRVIDTITFFNRLLNNKLMTQDVFTETRDQFEEKVINGRVAVFTSYDFANTIEKGNNNNKIDSRLYDVIWPPVKAGVDPMQVKLSGYTTTGWNVNVFSKGSESKMRRILHYMDWLTGPDGQRVLCYGPPGYFWDKLDEDGIPFWNEKYEKSTDKQRTDSQIFRWNWVGNASWVDIGKVAANRRLPANAQNPIVRMQGDVLWKTSWNENQYYYDRPDPASDLGIIDTQIADLYDEAKAKAIMAANKDEALAILNQAQNDMNSVGYDQFLAFHNDAWAKRKVLVDTLMAKATAGAAATVTTTKP